ncbi:hypothetical protein YC2023_112592 [Brassica napus]
MLTGFFSGSTLYACFGTWPDPNYNPHHIMLPRPLYLVFGLIFGYMFIRVTQEIYVNVHRKVRRLINYVKSWMVNHSTKEVEEEEEGCPICLEDLQRGSGGGVVVRLPVCLHRFHRDCVYRWLFVRPCCPTCRRFVAVGYKLGWVICGLGWAGLFYPTLTSLAKTRII